MPTLAASCSTALTKSTCSISWMNVNASPAAPHPKHLYRPVSSRTLNDGLRSAWKGHNPTQLRPTRRRAMYCCTTSEIDTELRSRSRSSSTIATAARLPEGSHGSTGAVSSCRCRSDIRTDTASTSTITASETAVGMWYQRLMIILTPTNARITARPCWRYSNRECMSASMKYSERRPMIANAFDVNTMNCSLLTASTAGTESTANSTSVDSTSNSTAKSGVA